MNENTNIIVFPEINYYLKRCLSRTESYVNLLALGKVTLCFFIFNLDSV